MPRDDALDSKVGKMAVYRELEEYKCFYFMNKLATGERSKDFCESKPVRAYSEGNVAVYCSYIVCISIRKDNSCYCIVFIVKDIYIYIYIYIL